MSRNAPGIQAVTSFYDFELSSLEPYPLVIIKLWVLGMILYLSYVDGSGAIPLVLVNTQTSPSPANTQGHI